MDDGGSDASYESVASEGDLEPACDRGRDRMPRIVSSSHCVEVFRRCRPIGGGLLCYPERGEGSRDSGEARRNGKAPPRPSPFDPCLGLPSRVLRFDGAMEAWLEEMPSSRDPRRGTPAYSSLNEAATRHTGSRPELSVLHSGNKGATIWYFTLEFLQNMWPCFLSPDDVGLSFWQRALLERSCTIMSTHVEVGHINYPPAQGRKERRQWLKAVFTAMQASSWTPDGEARQMLLKHRLSPGLSHASMSIGDAIQVGGHLFVATLSGFVRLEKGHAILPGDFDPETLEEFSEQEGDADSELAESESTDSGAAGVQPEQQVTSTKSKGKKGSGKGADKGGPDGSRKKGGGGKGRGKGKGKNGEDGECRDEHGRGGGKGGGRRKRQQRAKEPGPSQGHGADGAAHRTDRRKLRSQLQATREQLQG